MEQKQPSWIRSLQKSIMNNTQLEFWHYLEIAYVNVDEKAPECEMIKFRKLLLDEITNKSFLITTVDKRTKLYKNLTQNPKIQLCWFFPLSREKFRLKCDCTLISNDDYFKTNAKQDEISASTSAPLLIKEYKRIWDEDLNKEEKKEYTEVQPDSETIDKHQKKHDDLNDFNTPEVQAISSNFSVIIFDPYEIEHTKFIMPQVVADSRTTKFESLFSPYKQPSKHLHTQDPQNALNWTTLTLNP